MNFNKLFTLAKQKNIEPLEISSFNSSKVSVSYYQDQLENLTQAHDSGIYLRGIYEGKLGCFSSDNTDNKIADKLIEQVLENAKFGINGNPDFFLKPGLKYKRVHTYFKSIENVEVTTLKDLAVKLYTKIKSLDNRVEIVNTDISYVSSTNKFENSNKLKLSSKSNLIMLTCSIQARQNKQVQSGFDLQIITDLDKFNLDQFAEKIVKDTVSQFDGIEVDSNKYNVILNQNCSAILISNLIQQLSAYDVKNHLSLFEGKLSQKVLSNKLTILDEAHGNSYNDSSYDAEGYPTQNTTLIKNGILQSYIYDLETAKFFNTTSTGNGVRSGAKIIPGLHFIHVKQGRLSFDELVKKVNNGIYVTSLEGVGTGLNGLSGDYSLQASGYLIKDGKIDKPISLMTIAGNLLKDLNKIDGLANDSKITYYDVKTPSIYLKNISISGK